MSYSYVQAHFYFRLDIILVKRLSKHTISMNFSGMKIEPKYVFKHCMLLFLIFSPLYSFQHL